MKPIGTEFLAFSLSLMVSFIVVQIYKFLTVER